MIFSFFNPIFINNSSIPIYCYIICISFIIFSFFKEEINNTDKLVLIDFFATWCGPCKMLSPIIAEIANEHRETVKVCKVNTDENQELAIQYNIVSIPTLMFFKNGKLLKTIVGFHSKGELNEIINKLI